MNDTGLSAEGRQSDIRMQAALPPRRDPETSALITQNQSRAFGLWGVSRLLCALCSLNHQSPRRAPFPSCIPPWPSFANPLPPWGGRIKTSWPQEQRWMDRSRCVVFLQDPDPIFPARPHFPQGQYPLLHSLLCPHQPTICCDFSHCRGQSLE